MSPKRVAPVHVIGVGVVGPRPATPELSYKELMFHAAQRAYADARIEARDVQSFTTASEDLNEGTSIFDEYVPDQLGAVRKPVHTVGGDGLHALADAAMQIQAGLFDLCVVEAHSKASNLLTHGHVLQYATDPAYWRPFAAGPVAMAGLEMRRFCRASRTTHAQCAAVVVKNRRNALAHANGCYGASLEIGAVQASPLVCDPLTEGEIAPHADGAVVLVVCSPRFIGRSGKARARRAISLTGVGWATETPWPESRTWETCAATRVAARRAFAQSGIRNPRSEIAFAEVDDTYAYRELLALEALGLASPGGAGRLTERGVTARDGRLPVNPSGGSLGWGNLLEANGLMRAAEVVRQLRGEAGALQVRFQMRNSKFNGLGPMGLAHTWRGVPTTSAAVAVFAAPV